MNWLLLILLTLLQAFAGLGLLGLFRISLKPAMMLSLCVMMGVAIFSLVPFVLQLCYIPLIAANVFISLLVTAILLNIKYKRSLEAWRSMRKKDKVTIELYEIPFLIIIASIVLISVWRCYYLPPTPRDLTSGAEVIAEYAIKEKTMLNSVFTVNLESTNNQFKPPFIISLQIIYKYAGFYFGQIWLSAIFISFIVFLYHALNTTLHRFLSGLLVVAFLAIPEMYAYTFMVLFDYSNAVFFFLGFFFLIEYFKTGEWNKVQFAGLLFGFATYIRSETLILVGLMLPAMAWHFFRQRTTWKHAFFSLTWIMIPAAIFYIVSINVYINQYLPVRYNVEGLVNNNLFNLQPLIDRFVAINRQLLFHADGIAYYGYFVYLFLLLLLINMIFLRKHGIASRNWFFAVLVVYFGMAILGFLLPLLDVDHSTKRGFFKLFPLMLLYLGNSPLLIQLSQKLHAWEIKR